MIQGTAPPLMLKEHVINADSDLIVVTNCALLLICITFVVYLTIPRGARKQYCNSHPTRFARSSFVMSDCDVSKQRRLASPDRGYDAIDDGGYTSFAPRSPSRSDVPHRGCSISTPLIGEPGIACLSTGQAPTEHGRTDTALFSSSWFTPGTRTTRKQPQRTPATDWPPPPTLEENSINHSPSSSVLNQSECELSKKLLVLISSRCLDPQQVQNQRDAIALLRQRKVRFETVDGMNALQRSRYV